jgi:SHS2 domain-containing protein
MQASGFREIEHTADWELEAWGPDLLVLFEQAARGMYTLSGARLKDGPRQRVTFELEFVDPEGLLVSFLSELLYYGEQESLGFEAYQLSLEEGRLRAVLSAAPLASIDKEIKAVTYHNLAVRRTERGVEARIVFDV